MGDLPVEDEAGTCRSLKKTSECVVSKQKYLPFGEEMTPPGAETHSRRFTGHERDRESGLDYMLARYYGPGLGRFMSVDPREESADPLKPQSWNRYSYVLNRPLIAIDPTGEADVMVDDPKNLAFFEAELQKTAGPGIALTNKTIQVDDSQLSPGSKRIGGSTDLGDSR